MRPRPVYPTAHALACLLWGSPGCSRCPFKASACYLTSAVFCPDPAHTILQEVTNVRKKRHCGFPNSIEILWRGGKREFLTSFLSRDEAYRLIVIAWHNNR